MHDVTLLMPKIVKWINSRLSYFPGREQIGTKADDLYQDFKSGVNLACMIFLHVSDENLQPDFRMIYEHPQNR